ncbi:MAG: HEPN domain-containing protein [Planctomycetota bacterium]
MARIVERIRQRVDDIQMLILFGSHARDDWVEDIYTKGHITYEYISDFDILAIVETNRTANSTNIWRRLDKSINALHLTTPATIIAHDINFVNRRLKNGQYFFSDIKAEGIILYDSANFKLARRKKLDASERAELAKKDFKQWFKNAKNFYVMYEQALKLRKYKNAAFELHQATEAFYAAIMLVFTNYKPKSHDLVKLSRMAANYDRAFFAVFPQATDVEKDCFDLLNRAYVEARYDPDYKITKKQLEYLAQRVRKLNRLTKKICQQKIESFV